MALIDSITVPSDAQDEGGVCQRQTSSLCSSIVRRSELQHCELNRCPGLGHSITVFDVALAVYTAMVWDTSTAQLGGMVLKSSYGPTGFTHGIDTFVRVQKALTQTLAACICADPFLKLCIQTTSSLMPCSVVKCCSRDGLCTIETFLAAE